MVSAASDPWSHRDLQGLRTVLSITRVGLRLPLGSGSPLFTEMPRRLILGSSVGKKRAGAVRDPGPIHQVECFSEQTVEKARLFYIVCSF